MNYVTNKLEGQFIVKNDTRELFKVEGVYNSGDHVVVVGIDDNNKPQNINWTTHSSKYSIFGK